MSARVLLPILLLPILLVAVACDSGETTPARLVSTSRSTLLPTATFAGKRGGDGKLHVYFFDVGQGDAALIVSPTGKTVLVDAGPQEAAPVLVRRLPALLSEPLDLVVLSHPHMNHLGGLVETLTAVGTKRLLDPALPDGGDGHATLLDWVRQRDVEVFQPLPDPARRNEPVKIGLGGGAELALYWPRVPVEPLLPAEKFAEPNSVVMRVSYGRTSVLFTGDATAQTEQQLLQKRYPLDSTILKVASHGADRACTGAFLEQVKPRAAVISVGPGNALRAPARAVLDRLHRIGAHVFRTDLDGELHAVSDGVEFTVSPERPAAGDVVPRAEVLREPGPQRIERLTTRAPEKREHKGVVRFVASKKGKVFHVPSCRNAKRILPHNLLTFSTREQAATIRRPADDCHP